jgi:hypothetical protein
MTERTTRDPILTGLAVSMGLLAISNLMKPVGQAFAPEGPTGFVLLGQRLHGMANAIVGPAFGVLLGTYAYGVWNRRRWVVPLAFAYALYVVANLILFMFIGATPEERAKIAFNTVYGVVAIGVSAGGALYLSRNRDRLA